MINILPYLTAYLDFKVERKQVKSDPNQIGPKSNRPQIKSAPSQIGPSQIGPIFVVPFAGAIYYFGHAV
jgi:hypothetical protein